jgi:capsular polysaccharide biosynthesis protein
VVLDMEKDRQNVSYLGVIEQPTLPVAPLFPKKRIFAGGGLGVGLLLAGILAFLKEIRRSSYLSPYELAEVLETPLLGELPTFVRNRKPSVRIQGVKALGDGRISSDQKRLPATS